MKLLNKEELKSIREKYPEGTRVKLAYMDDPYTDLKSGDEGSVRCVDDVGTVFVNWDNGSGLGVVYGIDKIEIIEEETT